MNTGSSATFVTIGLQCHWYRGHEVSAVSLMLRTCYWYKWSIHENCSILVLTSKSVHSITDKDQGGWKLKESKTNCIQVRSSRVNNSRQPYQRQCSGAGRFLFSSGSSLPKILAPALTNPPFFAYIVFKKKKKIWWFYNIFMFFSDLNNHKNVILDKLQKR
jgi:hypothetical protein